MASRVLGSKGRCVVQLGSSGKSSLRPFAILASTEGASSSAISSLKSVSDIVGAELVIEARPW